MKIVGVIPARYASSRFPGKPLVDIYGKPMIWWVYQQTKKVEELDEIYVATDDERIASTCEQYNIKYIMTSTSHRNHMERLYEVSEKIQADLYVCVCGDEPLILPETIKKLIPEEINENKIFARSIKREFKNPAEVVDINTIKLVTNDENISIYMSRSPIPYPNKTLDFSYMEKVGVESYNKKALDFFYKKEPGILEKIEDIVLLRFVENNIPVEYLLDNNYTLSVDTPKDLEVVKKIIGKNMNKEN